MNFINPKANDVESDSISTEVRSVVIHTDKDYSMDLLCPHCHSLIVHHNVTTPICPKQPLYGCDDVRVAYMGVAPFIVFNPSDMSSPDGADVDSVNFIASKLNFKPKYTPEKSFGEYDLETKRATGMVKTVADDKADMGIGGISITYTRWNAVHFSRAYMGTEYAYAGTMPKPTDPFVNVVKVFDRYIWAWVTFVVLLMSVGFAAFYSIYKYKL